MREGEGSKERVRGKGVCDCLTCCLITPFIQVSCLISASGSGQRFGGGGGGGGGGGKNRENDDNNVTEKYNEKKTKNKKKMKT